VKYYCGMSRQRAVSALRDVLPSNAKVREHRPDSAGDVLLRVDGRDLLLRWLPVGWPRQVGEALRSRPRPQVLVAPQMSPGARQAAAEAGVGWVDESGAALLDFPNLRVRVDGKPVERANPNFAWRRATLAVCEALIVGDTAATVSSIAAATGLSTSTAATALKFLERDGFLTSSAARGRDAGRRVADPDALLDAYAEAASRMRVPMSISVGVLWRDSLAGAIEAGARWTKANVPWAATSALSAAAMAPVQTEIAPLEIYVSARTTGDLRRAADAAGLSEMDGGRLRLRPFPTPAEDAVSVMATGGLRSVLWPRVYADLRVAGVRGEDAAEHLREGMTRDL
jgi:hypothetical protein